MYSFGLGSYKPRKRFAHDGRGGGCRPVSNDAVAGPWALRESITIRELERILKVATRGSKDGLITSEVLETV